MKNAFWSLVAGLHIFIFSPCYGLSFDEDLFKGTANLDEGKENKSWYSDWHGHVSSLVGVAPSNHESDQFARSDTGVVESLHQFYAFKEWSLGGQVKITAGALLDYRAYHNHSRPEAIADWQYRDSEFLLRPQDTLIEWTVKPNLWLRHGYYVVSYGMADAFDVVDKLAPRDNSRWGQELSSSAREPLWLSQAIWEAAGTKVGLTVTHRFQGNRIALPGSDYDSFIELRSDKTIVNDPRDPANFKPEWVLDARGTFRSGDWAVVVGDIYNKNATLSFDVRDSQSETSYFTPTYTRTALVGGGLAYATGELVWKGELAWLSQYEEAEYGPGASGERNNSLLQALVGVDLIGPWSSRVSLESRMTRILRENEVDSPIREEFSLQIMKRWMYNRLYSHFRLTTLPDDDGRFAQVALEYDLSDRWVINAKYTEYMKTDEGNYFAPYADGDRVLLGLTHRF